MIYTQIYRNLVDYRRQNIPEGYTEKHHIVPKCLGGTNEKGNLVKLTAREHFIAHQLLVKIFPKEFGLIYAAFRMSNFKKYGSRKYAWLRALHSINQKGKILSAEHKKKISESAKGKFHSAESRKKMSEARKGKTPNKGKFHSAESRNKMSESRKGKICSEETKRKISESKKGKTLNLKK